jgi:hypothetical protein
MFWITKSYEIPEIDKACNERLKDFAYTKGFQFSSDKSNKRFWMKRPEQPKPKNMFSLHISLIARKGRIYSEVNLKPNIWLLCAMGILILMAVLCIFYAQLRRTLGLSLPLLFSIFYFYRIYAIKILGDLKAALIPDYLDSAKGRKEVYKGYTDFIRFFLNFQRNAYIICAIIFITAVILWMFGITDRIFPQP